MTRNAGLHIIVSFFCVIANNCSAQLSIVDSRFEVGYTGCSFQTTSPPIQNLNFDGIPFFKEFVTNCNYNSEDNASTSCPNQGVSNLESWFSIESAYWKEANHNIDRGVRDADWIRFGCNNIYLTTFCPLLYSNNEYPKGNFMLLQSELFKCKNNNDYKPNRKFHDAIRISFSEGKLETGRTHQIRVHMQHLGHPLFNDIEYGGDKILRGTTFTKYKQFVKNCFEVCPRHALHAKTLSFDHPVTGERLSFDSELPADMQALLSKWDGYVGGR